MIEKLEHNVDATARSQTAIEWRHGRKGTGSSVDISPAHDSRSPGEPGAEAAQDDQAAGLDPALGNCFVQRQWHGPGRGVAIAIQVVENPAARDVEHVDR